ncbi:ATP-binding cassette domain-containing protein [Salipiger pacificus]|nr:ATP-binding cassette domain-containing protein [Alloyangia pacifica]
MTPELAVRGELTLVSGPTGAGKTTLLRNALRTWRAAHPGGWPGAVLLGQNPATQLVADTVEEEVAFALVAAQVPQAEVARRTARALAVFGLADLARTRTEALSMGWKCRTLLAALHALEAEALFLDEPYAQLDADGQTRLDAAIEDWLARGCAVTVSADRTPETIAGLCAFRRHDVHPETGLRPEPGLVGAFCDTWAREAPPLPGPAAVELRSFAAGHEGAGPVLRDIDLALPTGTITLVSGANGSGKSTLLRAVAGDFPVGSGRRRLFGRTDAGLAPDTELVLQDPELHLTGRSVRGEIAAASVLRQGGAEICLRVFGLADFAERAALTLSHGQKQALVLACAMASSPRLLLLDEAFCGLDACALEGILGILREIVRSTGLTVLAVTHDPGADILNFADAHLRLAGGHLVEA